MTHRNFIGWLWLLSGVPIGLALIFLPPSIRFACFTIFVLLETGPVRTGHRPIRSPAKLASSIRADFEERDMFKTLFFLAALLAPGIAYGVTADLSITIQGAPPPPPPPPPPSAGTPAPAAAAGFTQLALNSDFTQPFYATKSNWLDCAGAASPEWWQGYVSVEGTNHVPCSYIGQVANDPAFPSDGPVLRMHWDDAAFVAFPTGPIATEIETVHPVTPAVGKSFTFYYVEVVARLASLAHTSGAVEYYNLWSVAKDGSSIEFDGLEVSGYTNNSNACYHNAAGGNYPGACDWIGQRPPNVPASFDMATQYHAYAWRITSDGTTGAQFCVWIDGNDQGCFHFSETPGQIAGDPTVATAIQLNVGRNGCSSGNCGIVDDMYVKSVKVWTCPAWSQSTQLAHCYSSSSNP